MSEFWGHLIKDGAAVAGFVLAASAALGLVFRSLNKAFGRGVKSHVEPLVEKVEVAMGGLSSTLQAIQTQQVATTAEFAREFREKESALGEHDAKLAAHDERLAEHDTELAVVNTKLDAPVKKPARRRS